MHRLGRNRGGYHGETISIKEVLTKIEAAARRHGWSYQSLSSDTALPIPVLTRQAVAPDRHSNRVYVSAGIHGDEPAGPLAMLDLLEADAFPADVSLWLCPCLNPSGFQNNTRASANGLDLNRDYRHVVAPETRAHIDWLRTVPSFDLTVCVHEDWEASGFYVYEVNPDGLASAADEILAAARTVCPIDLSPEIDGREAHHGLIRPQIDPALRPEWPEALYLLMNKTRLSYTVESPSDFELTLRVATLTRAVHAATAFIGSGRHLKQRSEAV